jgi:hypothetical protein
MRQPSPAATRQLIPWGEVMMIDQVLPSPVDSTSTRPPLLATPDQTAVVGYADGDRRLGILLRKQLEHAIARVALRCREGGRGRQGEGCAEHESLPHD